MLYGPRFLARSTISDENGRQTDMHAMPAHMALGSPSSEKMSSAVETTSVSLMYHQFLAERILNSLKISRKCLL